MADDPDDACNWLIDTGRMDSEKHVVMLCREGMSLDFDDEPEGDEL
tara:strand:- start:689 stop:826 length:138 start_codon:yes stop_codon:yes gene_type:complete